jgi:hypothetical protein
MKAWGRTIAVPQPPASSPVPLRSAPKSAGHLPGRVRSPSPHVSGGEEVHDRLGAVPAPSTLCVGAANHRGLSGHTRSSANGGVRPASFALPRGFSDFADFDANAGWPGDVPWFRRAENTDTDDSQARDCPDTAACLVEGCAQHRRRTISRRVGEVVNSCCLLSVIPASPAY